MANANGRGGKKQKRAKKRTFVKLVNHLRCECGSHEAEDLGMRTRFLTRIPLLRCTKCGKEIYA